MPHVTITHPVGIYRPGSTVDVSALEADHLTSRGLATPVDLPPSAGKGSTRRAWETAATRAGITVDDDMTRDDLIAAVQAGANPTVYQPDDDTATSDSGGVAITTPTT